MKTFYEMLKELEDSQDTNTVGSEDLKHYMFFSNLNVIKNKVQEILSMDPKELDAMLDDGHDWASDHISTSRDDIEEVYNWIIGRNK